MTGQPNKDDFYIPPATAGTPPPKSDGNDMIWIIIGIVGIFVLFVLPFIIAGFVFGMAGNVAHTKVVAATVQQTDAGTMIVTYQGGRDAGSVTGITTTVTDSSGESQTKVMGSKGGTTPLEIGNNVTFKGEFVGKDFIVSTAWFTDGTEQVILDNYV